MNRVALALLALLFAACELSVPSSSIDAGPWDAGGLLCDQNPCLNEGICTVTEEGFRCLCPAGYEGETCELDVNDCDPNPCMNEGVCSDGVASYTCACAPGFTGVDCSTNIDECADAPCENGGACTDVVNGFQCDCAAGYTGSRCEVNVDDCSSLPCENDGECQDEINGFTCTCKAGNTGPTCSNQVENCSEGICQHGGTCQDAQDGYVCTCAAGYNGVNCETDVDDCAALPCQNGASCADKLNGYDCECPDGYDGVDCENLVDPCNPNPCQNSGACTSAGDFYVCSCAAGYNGMDCEHNIDDCSANPCKNGGTCSDLVDDFSCACPTGFTGPTCNNEPPTCPTQNPCGNGVCSSGINGYKCDCNQGYIGGACEVNVDDCQPNPCQNGGTCVDGVNDYTCTCDTGYEGPDCQGNIDDCASSPCENDGVCSDRVNGFDCACKPGWGGDTCMADIDECLAEPCQNGGTCTDQLNGYTCECPPGFQGLRCETDHCSLIGVCGNGTCDGQGGCDCMTGWTGDTCGDDIDECAAQTPPCLHGGACADTDGSFSCTCPTGYKGQLCAACDDGYQDNDDDTICCREGYEGPDCNQCEAGYENLNGLCQITCVSTGKDCGDHGTCADNDGMPACACDPTWYGEWCDSLMGTCSESACGGHGECNDTSVNTYKCTCDTGYSGRSCELADECVLAVEAGNTPCLNGGSCVDGDNAYTCMCEPGWLGADCGESDDCYVYEQQTSQDPCSDHGSCVDGNSAYTCTCTAGWLNADCSEQDNCVGNMCQRGLCVDGNNTYTCDCAGTNYQGQFCEAKIDYCANTPCKNGGACTDQPTTFSCDCARTGFSGATCETDQDECADTQADVCKDGTCVNVAAGGGYTCQCPDGTIDVDGDGTNCSDVASLAAGGLNTCAITTAGSLHCWGDNSEGQLGIGTLSNPAPSAIRTPQRVGTGTGWTKVSIGNSHTCGLRNGHLFCWGNNTNRQTGVSGNPSEALPVAVRADLTWSDVSAGGSHTCAISGTDLYCWGNSANLQAGTPVTAPNVDAPKQIAGSWLTASSGGNHTCAINTANELRCWGYNNAGQTTGSQPIALPVGNSGPWSSVKAGPTHTCAVAGTRSYCWGAGTEGALGDGGAFANSSSPVEVSTSSNLGSLATGQDFSCGVLNDSDAGASFQIYCWGSNADGLLLAAGGNVNVPQIVTGGGSPSWTAYAVGSHHMCAVDGGFAHCWGSNAAGAVGNAAPSATLVTAATRVKSAVITHSGASYCEPNPCRNGGVCSSQASSYTCDCTGTGFTGTTCTTQNDQCAAPGLCGQGTCQNLLDDDGYSCTCPDGLIDVDGTGTTCGTVATIAAGANHSCVLTDAGTLHCWGTNRYGQLGLGVAGTTNYYPNESSQTIRTPLRLRTIGANTNVSGWNEITVGDGHTCGTLPTGVASNEALYCWGNNAAGQVGRSVANATDFSGTPYLLDDQRSWTSLVAGGSHTCGITAAGTLHCWGQNNKGQIGNGLQGATSVVFSAAASVPLPGTATSWTAVSAGTSHTCAITNEQNMYCWGRNTGVPASNITGQIGNNATGGTADVLNPTLVVFGGNPQGFTAVAIDSTHSCGLIGANAYCWGQGTTGGIGDGANSNRLTPVAVSGGLSFSGLALGGNFTCGLVAIGGTTPQAYSSWCWGNNLAANNMLLSASTSRNTPLQVTTREWRLFDVGSTHACGVDNGDGLLYCWGNNGLEDSVGQGKLGRVPYSLTGAFGVGPVKARPADHLTP